MSRGAYPTLLMLAMSLPGTVRALGLGEIRVDSSLNEPLSAQIDIVGATHDELLALTASVANREIFQRYGADRPAFLSTATFKVGLDAQGRPVLNVRSGEPFTDPLVSFLVDLRWGKNEVVREYSLLLDPAGFNVPQHAAEAAMAAVAAALPTPTPVASRLAHAALEQPAPVPATPAPAATAAPKTAARVARSSPADNTQSAVPTHHRIAARDTLRGIARHAGARGESEVQRMMIAIFRANPNAFEDNINRLRRGAVLSLPSADQVAAISPLDAKREVRSQMTAWRLDGRRGAPSQDVEAAGQAVVANESPARAAAAADAAAAESADDSLKTRVQFLEQSLQEMHQQLARHNAQLKDLGPAAALAAQPLAAQPSAAAHALEPTPASASPAPLSGTAFIGPLAAGLALLVTGVSYARSRLRRAVARAPEPVMSLPNAAPPPVSAAAGDVPIAPATVLPTAAASAQRTQPPEPATVAAAGRARGYSFDDTTILTDIDTEALERSYLDSLGIETSPSEPAKVTAADAPVASTAATDDTVQLAHRMDDEEEDTLEASTTAALNTLDLDATAEHVQMPSGLNDRAVVSEGRANIVDALKMAIDRDPHRRDLRMKLLETYFSAALNNQRAFVDVVRKLARDRDKLSADDWNKVVKMGQEIAAEDILFAGTSKHEPSDQLADCA
jgi:pilus assembly protein FimV